MTKSLLITKMILLFVSCTSTAGNTKPVTADREATPETSTLYVNMHKTVNTGILFGHQDALAYGVHWKYQPGKSDVKDVTGDHPAVYGWDIAGIEKNSDVNIDGVPFAKMRQFIAEAHQRGGINTISWHLDNPMNGKNAWDTSPGSVQAALPGGAAHDTYTSWLDKTAAFLLSLQDSHGRPIPILFRPFHEVTGDWFWWCKNNTSGPQSIALWRFTATYLQKKGVHNLIYVYNTANFANRQEFLEYYPGPDHTDIISFDSYQYSDPRNDNSFVENCQRQFAVMHSIAKEHNKLMAFAETGYEQIPYNKWFTDTLSRAIGEYKISYVLVWRNHGWNESSIPPKMHYYVPFSGHPAADDFIKFYKNKRILFESDAAKAKLYTP